MTSTLMTSPSGKSLIWLGGGYSTFQTLAITLTRTELEAVPDAVGLVSTFELLFPDGYQAQWTQVEQIRFLGSPLGRWLGRLVKYQVLPAWDLSRLDLSEVDLRLKDLSGLRLAHSKLPLDMRAADLRQADLTSVRAIRSDFCGANFSGSIMDGADLRGASFVEAALHGVEMSRCRMQGSYWRETVLKHSRLTGSNLTGSTWVDCLLEDVDDEDVIRDKRVEPDKYVTGADGDQVPVWYWRQRAVEPLSVEPGPIVDFTYDEDGQPHPVYLEDSAEDVA